MVLKIQSLLSLRTSPVAIGFFEKAPANLPPWEGGAVPSSCFFWKKVAQGEGFYTMASDHYNCAVGSYVHHIPLPLNREKELSDTIEFMVEKNYIDQSEIPQIPTLTKTPPIIAYSPLEIASFKPDVVLVSVKPHQAMILYEAVLRMKKSTTLPIFGRPACSIIPWCLEKNRVAISFGCIGNRTFTGLPEDELYACFPGSLWDEMVNSLIEVVKANQEMQERYLNHQSRFLT